MPTRTAHRHLTRGFTLIELLVVMGIIAVLASMLLPAMFAVSQQTKVSNTEALLKRIAVALDTYHKAYAYYPPDFINQNRPIVNLQGTLSGTPPTYTVVPTLTNAYPAEALYYYLCHRYLSREHPMLNLRLSIEASDTQSNGLPEIIDSWGRPILYNRRAFPAVADTEYNFAGNPKHNAETYDLYSVGPDGQTGAGKDLPEFGPTTMALFCTRAMDNADDGNQEDDICNWKK